jgi:hypothetical protein
MAETKQPANADKAAPLSKAEQAEVRSSDTRDVSPRVASDTSGQRVRAIFYGGGTTKEVSKADFRRHGIDHGPVVFDFRVNEATLPVNPRKDVRGLSEEAAQFLTETAPTEFEYMNQEQDQEPPAES